jgi:hypothetical protein
MVAAVAIGSTALAVGNSVFNSPGDAPTFNAQNSIDQQTKANQSNAAYNAQLNRYNTTGPLGSQTFQITGTDPTTGAPIYNQHIGLTGTGQQTLDKNQSNQLGAANLQNGLFGSLQNSLQPVNYNSLPALQSNVNQFTGDQSIQNAVNSQYGAQMALVQPGFDQANTSLQTQLANQGINPGSEAYNNAIQNQGRSQGFTTSQIANNATQQGLGYQNQLFGQGLQNANLNNQANQAGLQNLFSLQNQPLSQYERLNNLAQTQLPSYASPGPTNANSTDAQGALQQQYQAQLGGYNADVASSNALTNGLFSLGAGAISSYGKK